MSQANVNVGTAPGAGNGDTLYNAFTKINTNFTELYSTITSSGVTYANISPSVDSSVAGSGLTLNITKYANIYGVSVNLAGTSYALGETVRIWGNVLGGTYTTNDIVVSVSTLANSSIGSVGTVTFTGTPSKPVLTVSGRTGDVVLTTNDIVGLATTYSPNVSIQNAVDGKIASNIANLIGTAPGVLDTLGEIADALNDDANVYNTLVTTITTANVNLKGYTDDLVTTANVNLKGYTDDLVTTANTNVVGYTDNAVSTANVNLKGYVDAANVNVVGYVDGQITNMVSNAASQSGELASLLANAAVQAGELTSLVANAASQNDQINTANVNLKGYTDDLVTTANVNVVGYVDGEVTTLNSAITTANTNVVGYVDNAVSTANVNLKGYTDNQFTTGNTNVVGYVDGEVTTLNSAITTANTNVVGYVDDAVSTANVNLKGYTDGQFTTGNTNVVGYVDNAVSTANVNLKGYVDSEISDTVSATGSSIADANVNLKGYTDNLVTTANVNVVGYIDNEIAGLVDSAPGTLDTLNEIAAALGDDPNLATTLTNTISTANVNVVGYVDGEVTTLNSAITTANTNVVGYVDSAVSTANVNLKGYVDSLSHYTDSDVADYLPTYNGNIGGLVTGGPTMEYFGNLTAGASQGNLEITQSNAVHQININGNVEIINGNLAVQRLSVDSISTVNGGNLRIGQEDTGDGVFVAATMGSAIALGNVHIYADSSVSPYYLYIDAAGTTTKFLDSVEIVGNLNTHTIPGGTGTIALTSDVTTANVNVVGYVDNAVSTANVNLKGYVDDAVSNIPDSYTNANVNALLASWGSNTLSTTGNVTVGNIAVGDVNIGYVEARYVIPPSYNSGSVGTTARPFNSAYFTNLIDVTDPGATGTTRIDSGTVDIDGSASLTPRLGIGDVDIYNYGSSLRYKVGATANVFIIENDSVTVSGNISAQVNGYDIGYKIIPQVAAGNVTIALADSGKHYYSTDANPTTLTIPLNSSVAFDTGTAISIVNQGTGNISVALTGGVTMYLAGDSSSGGRTITTYGMATLMKVATDTWFINGTGVV